MDNLALAHKLSHDFKDVLKFCGCGNPSAAACLVRDILRLSPLYDHQEELGKLLPSKGIVYFVLYSLNEAGLFEHGGSVGGGWLTEAGKKFLKDLELVSVRDPDLDSVFLGMDEYVPEDCPKCCVEKA